MLSINGSDAKNLVKLGVSLHARVCSCALRYFAVYREMVESEVYSIVCEGHFRSLATFEFFAGTDFLYASNG